MPNQILNEEQFERNEQLKLKLIELIGSGDSILLAGAGVTTPMFLDWQGLVQKFEDEARAANAKFKAYDGSKETYLPFFDRVKKVLRGNKYTNIIHTTFRTDNFDPYHKVLVSMPFKGFVTTNYDLVLENALAAATAKPQRPVMIDDSVNSKVVLEFLKTLTYSTDKARKTLHLHGVHDTPLSIVLSQTEYKDKYGFVLTPPKPALFQRLAIKGISQPEVDEILKRCSLRWTTHRKVLWSLLATRRVVFMGFSVRDPYFLGMLDMVRDDLNTLDDDMHIAVFRLTTNNQAELFQYANKLKENYGIEAVYFEDDDPSDPGFSRFLNEIAGQMDVHPSVVQPGRPAVGEIAEVPAPALTTVPTPAAAELPAWLGQQEKILSKEIRNEDQQD